MFPIGDDNSRNRSFPFITYALIALNFYVFFLETQGGMEFIYRWAFVPARFVADPIGDIPTLFTSMFMHAGWAHILGNMIYLWIFGDNVEDRFGHLRFVAFYLVCGFAATTAQFLFTSGSEIPLLGASGAIAGVLGAYFLMFPRGQVYVLFLFRIVVMPAALVLGFWIILQLFSTVGAISRMADAGGVAYMAHVGGFAAGLILAKLIRPKPRSPSYFYDM
jgi:membrane associated rhomboid family serine protease